MPATDTLLRSPQLYVPLLAVLLAAFWLHALQVPFWQDDFHFLLVAREAREAGETWLSVFWPVHKSIFWRPLSEGLYWRIVEGPLDANSVAAHLVNLCLLVAAALAVAWLVSDYVRLIDPRVDPHKAFLGAGFLFGMHAAHFIPAVWATAVHSSMVVLFSALSLRFWLSALRASPADQKTRLSAVPLFLLLALFSKESAILTLPLGVLLTASAWNRLRPITGMAWGVAVASVLLSVVWLLVRREFVVPPAGAYELGIGTNTLRNLASMGLFFFNVPRESLRFLLEQQSALAAAWALVCALLQVVAVGVVLAAAWSRLRLIGVMAAAAFFLLAGAPYLLFSWNAYAYYITLGLIVWPFLAVVADLSAGRLRLVLGAALLSSGLSVAGNFMLDYPALLARADWADRQLEIIRTQFPSVADRVRSQGIDVLIENRHKFLGIGVSGLSLALDLPAQSIRVVDSNPSAGSSAVRLIIPDSGNARFE